MKKAIHTGRNERKKEEEDRKLRNFGHMREMTLWKKANKNTLLWNQICSLSLLEKTLQELDTQNPGFIFQFFSLKN